MTDEEQEAHALKFEPGGLIWMRQLSTNNFALYRGGNGAPFWIGPADQIATAYAKRPGPSPKLKLYKPATLHKNIDVSALKISI